MTETMTIQDFEEIVEAAGDTRVCVFCDETTDGVFCGSCGEYKGLMSIAEWEEYTGETWED